MAYQAPNLQSLSGTAIEIWPSLKASLPTPWKSLRQSFVLSNPFAKPFSTARNPESTKFDEVHGSPLLARQDLPECLSTVPLTSLQGPRIASASFSSLAAPWSIPMNHRIRQARIPPSRSFATLPPFLLRRLSPIPLNYPLSPFQRRNLAAGSSSQNLLAHMEQTANNNPTSATAQNAFYSALLRANMPAIVVERFQTGRYASNAACETTFLRALERVGHAEGMSNTGANSQYLGSASNINENLQAVGQVAAAQSRGGNIAMARGRGPSAGNGAKETPLYVVVEETMGGTIFKWAKFLLYFGLVTYFSLVLVTVAIEMTGMLKKVGSLQNNEAQPQHQTVRFDDVQGCDEAKEELQELVEFLKAPEKFSTLGGKLPKGVLLVGPPGTGKTLLARAVAGEAGVPFFFMSGSEFDEVYVGVGAKRIRELFNAARAKAPAIVFIDELDAVGGKRNDRDAAYVKQTLNQLLTELDGFSQQSGVIILAATNFPQLLDKALTRPGRFDRNVTVPLPDVRGRMNILRLHMKKIKVGPEVDESIIARGTSGFSGADLENLVNQAAVRASKNKALEVNLQDFDWAKDKILMGSERRSAIIQEKDKIQTAYHEGGHTLMAMFTRGALPVYKATIMPRGPTLGVTYLLPEMDVVSRSKRECLAEIDVCMGGKVAEELVYGPDGVTSGASSDLENATAMAHAMVTQMGFSDALGNVALNRNRDRVSGETSAKIDREVQRLLEEGYERAKKLLKEKRKELDILANALVEHEMLTLEEIQKVLKGEKLDRMTAGPPSVPIKVPIIFPPPGVSGSASSSASTAAGSGAGTKSESPSPPSPPAQAGEGGGAKL